jgi:hypothetical protein
VCSKWSEFEDLLEEAVWVVEFVTGVENGVDGAGVKWLLRVSRIESNPGKLWNSSM